MVPPPFCAKVALAVAPRSFAPAAVASSVASAVTSSVASATVSVASSAGSSVRSSVASSAAASAVGSYDPSESPATSPWDDSSSESVTASSSDRRRRAISSSTYRTGSRRLRMDRRGPACSTMWAANTAGSNGYAGTASSSTSSSWGVAPSTVASLASSSTTKSHREPAVSEPSVLRVSRSDMWPCLLRRGWSFEKRGRTPC